MIINYKNIGTLTANILWLIFD